MTTARERWNEIRRPPAAEEVRTAGPRPPGPQPAGGEGSPSVVVGQPGWQKWLERNGMNPAFDEDDAWTKRIRGY
jgi:hypothetical protein